MRLELLETRALLTYAYPYGAMPDDTGEYMLGDVAVNVVLMESDATMAPYDNNATTNPDHPGHGLMSENWDPSPGATGINSISVVKQNITAALQWWKDTLVNMFPSAGNLLNFEINWTYADHPVHTGYEPIARISNDFSGDSLSPSGGKGWIYDFLHEAGYDSTGNFSTDLRAFNDYTRQQAGTDWATTIFVVNNANDADKLLASGGSFQQAFSFAGGRFEIVPASRPVKTFAHETGHQFWALDQYLGGGSYDSQRGYYNTQNLNAADNPAPGFVQADSIMSNDPKMQNSFVNHTLDPYTMGQIGWQDSDDDGIFDVLDVPFSLSGYGQYNLSTGKYEFRGASHVNALPNQNSSGTGDDITINQVRVAEVSFDDGQSWQGVAGFPDRTYDTPVSLDIPVGAGISDIWIRTRDPRSGVVSNIFEGEVNAPTQDDGIGVSGIVFVDHNGNGARDAGDELEPNVGLVVLDETDQPVNLAHFIEPNDYLQGAIINSVPEEPDATLSAIGANSGSGDVVARTSTIAAGAGKAFTGSDILNNAWQTWNSAQGKMLRVDFASGVSTVSLHAYGGGSGSSYGRLDAYTGDGKLVTRFSTGGLTSAGFVNMTVSRPQGDIAYVIAYGNHGTGVVLDSLTWGPAATATSNSQGAYSLDYLPDGTYHIRMDVPAGYHLSTPAEGYASIAVAGGRAGSSVNFGIAPDSAPTYPFHKDNPRQDVNNDGFIAPNDALLIINYINGHTGEGEIAPGLDPLAIGYIDVLADGICAPNDVLDVINWINSHPVGGGEGPSAPTGGGGGESGGGEGELNVSVPVPTSAADYFSQLPVHFDDIPDAVPDLDGLTPAAASTGSPAATLLLKTEREFQAAIDSAVSRKLPFEPQDLMTSKSMAAKLEVALDEIAADVCQAEIAADIRPGW